MIGYKMKGRGGFIMIILFCGWDSIRFDSIRNNVWTTSSRECRVSFWDCIYNTVVQYYYQMRNWSLVLLGDCDDDVLLCWRLPPDRFDGRRSARVFFFLRLLKSADRCFSHSIRSSQMNFETCLRGYVLVLYQQRAEWGEREHGKKRTRWNETTVQYLWVRAQLGDLSSVCRSYLPSPFFPVLWLRCTVTP